jgi:hypothetical protein
MRHASNRTGVCLIRIEEQGDEVLIRVRWNPDVDQVSTERVIPCTDVDSAVAAVRELLTGFVVGEECL